MGNSASASLPYSIGTEEYAAKYTAHHTGWAIHNGSQKSNPSQPVSVFKFSKAANAVASTNPLDAEVRLLAAQHHFLKIKTLVHPHILRANATLDTDNPDGTSVSSSAGAGKDGTLKGDLIVVTEHVIPLSAYLNRIIHSADDSENNAQVISNTIAWGLVTIIEALHFLHSTAQLSHGRVCIDSIYVTKGGDFKLGDFSLLTKIDSSASSRMSSTLPRLFTDLQSILTPKTYMSPERLEQRWDLVSGCPSHIMDSYSMGILIQELYTTYSSNGSVPQKLVKAIQRLTTSNVKLRPRLAPLLKCPVFKESQFVQVNSVLDNLSTKPAEEKLIFLQKLPDMITKNIVHKQSAEYKVLPEFVRSVSAILGSEQSTGGVIQQDVARREILAIIAPLYQITYNIVTPDNITTPTFTHTITPLLISLFTINDRGIRGALLTRFIPILAANFPAKSLNTAIFEPMCSGFTDSSAALRELTLKSSLPLVPILNSSNLDKLCRYLIRLQNDSEPSVRTNTIIFVGKIANHLSPTNRANLILPAFTRAMTDSFTPCRLAALRAVSTCKAYFDTQGIATKVLPVVVPHLVDSVSSVRTEAYAVVDTLMIILKEESDRRSNLDEEEVGTSATGPNGTHSTQEEQPVSSSYFSSFSSWATGSKSSQTDAPKATPSPSVAPPPVPAPTPSYSTETNSKDPSALMTNMSLDNDGWSDEEDNELLDDGLEDEDMVHEPSWMKDPTPTATKLTSLEDEDALFSSAFSNTAPKPAAMSTKKLATPKLKIASKPKQQTSGMSLSERKAEFEKRKLERMEKRLKQWEKDKDNSKGNSSNTRGTVSNLNGWSDFSR